MQGHLDLKENVFSVTNFLDQEETYTNAVIRYAGIYWKLKREENLQR